MILMNERMNWIIRCVAWLATLGTAVDAFAAGNVNNGRYDAIHIVPAPGKVTIDGDLSEWDRSGEFFSYRFEFDKDKRNVRGVMMYDAEHLYIGAHIGDSTPMVNSMNPETDAKSAWRGDC